MGKTNTVIQPKMKYLEKKNKYVIVFIIIFIILTILLIIFFSFSIYILIINIKINKKYFNNKYDYSLFINNCYKSKTLNISTNSKITYNGNIPISFNKKNLNICDFYYPGSYNSFMSGDPANGIYTMESIKIAINKFKCRILHLDIYKDNNNNPVVRSKYQGVYKPLVFEDVLSTINLNCWNISKYPMFIYLTFNFEAGNATFKNVTKSVMKIFGKYLLNSNYSYNCRNNTYSIINLAMNSAIGKVIFISNMYPTNSNFDEIINLKDTSKSDSLNTITGKTSDTTVTTLTTPTTQTTTTYINFLLRTYKESYNSSSVGLLLENTKDTLILNNTNTLLFYYNSSTSPVVNPNFIDCSKYGIQATLMYLFNLDNNMYEWYNFFAKNNGNPILKPENLRITNYPQTTTLTTNTVNPSETGGMPGFLQFTT
jgi:hypothetical protein